METSISHFLQHQIDNFQAEVTMAAYTESKPEASETTREQELYRLIFVDKGSGSLEIGERAYGAESGRLFLVPTGLRFSFRTQGSVPLGMYWCHFRPEPLELPFIDTYGLPLSVEVCSKQEVKRIFDALIDAHGSESATRKLRMRASLMELFACYLDECLNGSSIPCSRSQEPKWNDVLAYVEQNLSGSITVEDMAKVAYLHPNYFITAFKSMMGISPIQYVTERRLIAAKQMLAETEMPITEIAGRVGLLNHYLSRLFKRYTGITPMQFRRIVHAGSVSKEPGT